MSGDYTRFSFEARKRYSGVLMQQGRVQLDSDWNEAVDILKRRVRTQALDSFGPVGVPFLTTPDAFRIGLLPGPDLSIEPGRLYVDGLMAELLADETATYLAQPFLPDPPPLPGGDAVVYLDVWEREVTYIEDPDLLDVALGGADTATRTQTVWQVRVDERQGAACGQPVGDPPSAGRLTTAAIAPPAPDDPCILPPLTGYRGLENRLYRVEIHEGGALGTARFRWSRDNGSIVAAVTELAVGGADTTLTVSRIGRDAVMRFRIDDWVAVTDDRRELNGAPVAMARIIDIDGAARHLVLDRALPVAGAGAFATTAADLAQRHTRVQRWDESAATNVIDGDGLVLTGPGPIPIEAGIEVRFGVDPAGGAFRTGDYWVFAARTADASVEELIAAPPRGIEHRYAQLAAITGLGGPDPGLTDCRPSQPPEGERCCCVSVAPGESIQAAIDGLPSAGGCVCLLPGVHAIEAPIRILRDNVTLKSESGGAVVRASGSGPLLLMADADAAFVSRIVFERIGEAGIAAIAMLTRMRDVAIEDCGFRSLRGGGTLGVFAGDSERLRVERTAIAGVAIGIGVTGRSSAGFTARDNRLDLAALRGDGPGLAGIVLVGAPGFARIKGNDIAGALSGVIVNDAPSAVPESVAETVEVVGNRIALAAPSANDPAGGLIRIGVDLACRRSLAGGNLIAVPQTGEGAATGIRLTGFDMRALDNGVLAIGEGPAATTGIQLGFRSEAGVSFAANAGLVGNRVDGLRIGILATDAGMADIAGNRIEAGRAAGSPAIGISISALSSAQIHDNHVARCAFAILGARGRANRIRANDLRDGSAGVFLIQETGPVVAQNRVSAMSAAGIAVAGIGGRCDVIENRVTNCGFGNPVGFGLIGFQIVGEFDVKANEVMDTGLDLAGGSAARTAIGIFGSQVLEAGIEGNLVTYSTPTARPVDGEDRALLMQGLIQMRFVFADREQFFGFPVAITNNKFIGAGRSALVELRTSTINDNVMQQFERVFFSNNYCMHICGQFDDRLATVVLVGRAGTVIGNHVKSATPFLSFDFNGMHGPFVGNVTGGGVIERPGPPPAPDPAFNIQL